ncbi:MAG: hypothetical protein ACTH31_16800 [Pseudoclavibacter sp.]
MVHGLGARLDWVGALTIAVAAILVAAAGSVAQTNVIREWHNQVLPDDAARWGTVIATAVVCPALVSVGAVALVRHRGPADGRALLVIAVALPAFALAGVAGMSWSLGSDAANRNAPNGWFEVAWSGFALVAWAICGTAIALLAAAMLGWTWTHPVTAVVIVELIGAAPAPILGFGLLSPYLPTTGAVFVGILALRARTPE